MRRLTLPLTASSFVLAPMASTASSNRRSSDARRVLFTFFHLPYYTGSLAAFFVSILALCPDASVLPAIAAGGRRGFFLTPEALHKEVRERLSEW